MKKNLVARICMPVVILFVTSLFLSSMTFAESNTGQGRIDLNAATVKELSSLFGIGKKKAEAIIAYRVENGKFESADEIKKVDGIGKKTFSRIKEEIFVE